MKKLNRLFGIGVLLCLLCIVLIGCRHPFFASSPKNTAAPAEQTSIQPTPTPYWGMEAEPKDVSYGEIPPFYGSAYVTVNRNTPQFTERDISMAKEVGSFENYGKQDSLFRCTAAMACIGKDLMPTDDRGEISSVYPSGWHDSTGGNNNTVYDFVERGYLYNRCHLIGYQLTAENDNEQNLITGTRYLNVKGMLPFENKVARYVRSSGNHVLYRVTPSFTGENLICDGVYIEAYSLEDAGKGISFFVYCYNVEPGVSINYEDGTNSRDPEYVN